MRFEYCFLWIHTQLPTPKHLCTTGSRQEARMDLVVFVETQCFHLNMCDDHHRCFNERTGERQEMMHAFNGFLAAITEIE